MPRITHFLLLAATCLALVGCKDEPACPPRSDADSPAGSSAPTASVPEDAASPTEVKINGRNVLVDKIVAGSMCNDTWRGTVYVTCDVQVSEWENEPLFLKDCNLSIEPGTVVYVAYHNDTAYYNGCSCHTGEQP